MRTIIAAAACAAALAGCTEADSGSAHIDAWALASATPVAPPVDCIEQSRIRGHAVRDDRTIDFSLDDGGLVRNRLPYSCAGLLRTTRFTFRTALPRLCSTDLITLVRSDGSAGGNCGLGLFQPIAIPPRQGALPRG